MKEYYDNNKLARIKYLVKNKKFNIALQEIEEYKLQYPFDVVVNKYNVYILCEQGLFKEAEELCLDVLNSNFHEDNLKAELYRSLGHSLIKQNRKEEAIIALEKALELRSKNTQIIQELLSDLYYEQGDLQRAFYILEPRKENEDNNCLLVRKGDLYYKNNDYNNALKILLNIDEMNLKSMRDIQLKNLDIGYIYLNKYKYDLALKYFKKVLLAKNEFYYFAYIKIAYIEFQLGNVDKTIGMCEEIIKKMIIPDALNLLIKASFSTGDVKKAEEKINIVKDEYLKKYYLGLLHLNKNNYLEAHNTLEELLELNVLEKKYELYAKYYLIICKYRLGKYQEVIDLVAKMSDDSYLSEKETNELKSMSTSSQIKLNSQIIPARYMEYQMLDYSKSRAIEHITEHHLADSNISKFYDEMYIEKIYDYFIDNSDNLNKTIDGFLDKYSIHFDNDIGESRYGNLNSVSVLCLPDTKNVITMYPANNATLIDQEEEVKEKPKVKRLSQIEKFNKKYNID